MKGCGGKGLLRGITMNKELRFSPEGKFRILMVSDFHERPGEGRRLLTNKLVEGLEALLEHTKPDMVLVGGDQCLDANDFDGMKRHMEYMLSPVLERKLPWGAVFGNHDREAGHELAEEQRVYESIEGCVSHECEADISGTGNHVIEILSSKDNSTAFHIWGLDSHAEARRDFVKYLNLPEHTQFVLPEHFNDGSWQGGVMPDQVMWYYNESLKREKKAGKKIPAIMYLHIPIPEYCLVARNPEECGAKGSKREKLCCPELNSGLFMSCLQRGDVKGIFCGHEHLIDFDGKYCGVTLAYDACMGYNMSAHDDLRGGRVIDITEDGTLDTHCVKLLDIMGERAIRSTELFEGGCKYHFRKL